MKLVERAKAVMLRPKSEWPVIETEPDDIGFLFTNYVVILAAIPPACTVIGGSLAGYGHYHVSFFVGLAYAVSAYALTLISVAVLGFIIDILARTFGGQSNLNNAMKVAAYAPTAGWLVGVFNLIPFSSILTLLGLYSVYLLHTGIAILMKPAADKALYYTIAVVVCMIAIDAIIFYSVMRAIIGLLHV